MDKMNATLIEGIRITRAECFCIPSGSKKHSLSSLLWGFGYGTPASETVYVPAKEEKAFRDKCLGDGGMKFSLRRACVLAKNIISSDLEQQWASYFDVYRHLYGCH
uniref:Uncharacterized protein n=1 Tax=uncultured bacterium contig00061 TaxID=1181544 RepID=A0A806JZ05_9BACT|nr:hypothetical protein [uncultured bacterium contig00061]